MGLTVTSYSKIELIEVLNNQNEVAKKYSEAGFDSILYVEAEYLQSPWPFREWAKELTPGEVYYFEDFYGSLGFSVKKSRFGGVWGAPHPTHPQIWEPPRRFPESHFYYYLFGGYSGYNEVAGLVV